MDEFLKWLSSNSIVSTILVASFCALVVSAVVIYFVAFLQGREVFFWPPKVGAKPDKPNPLRKEKPSESSEQEQTSPEVWQKIRNEMKARISFLERENTDLKARLAFMAQVDDTPAQPLPKNIADDISALFLKRDRAVSGRDIGSFLETQLNEQEIGNGSSKGYTACSKLATSILAMLDVQSHVGKKSSEVDYAVLVREDYDHDYQYSHSGYIVYQLARTGKGLKITALRSLRVA